MNVTRRTVIRAAAAALVCPRCPGATPARPATNPARDTDVRLIGYGLVNRWFAVEADHFASLLHDHGCNLTEIEYFAWFDADGPKGTSVRHDVKAAARFVSAMRQRDITTLISVVNWNGKAQRAQDDRWFAGLLLEITERIGSEGVLLLPVSEPDDGGKSVQWQRHAKEHWPGTLVLNGPGGRGDPTLEGANYIDWHWCEDFAASNCKRRPYVNNTDCGPVLNPGPKRVARMAAASAARNAHFHIYDHSGNEVDVATIRAIGK